MLQAIETADTAVLLFVQVHVRCAFLDGIMKTASFLGNGGLLWIVLAVILLFFSRTRRGALDMALCLAVPWLLTEELIKNLVCRPRPYLALEGLVPIVAPLPSYCFPSGHTSSAFAAATALHLAFRGIGGAWAYLPAALIVVSRVYVGVHYPSDVLAGAAIGALLSWAVFRLSRRIIKTDLSFPWERNKADGCK
jgi:undecaprenyl-diphosphatase